MRSEVAWKIDEAGQLRGVRYHDGYVVRFALDTQLKLAVRATDDSLTELVLSGIKTLCTDPLWESAIVTDIDVWKAADAPIRYWKNLLQGREGLEGIEAHRARYLPACANFWLVEMSTAYGGGFTCLCEAVQVFSTQI
jgi:hypothetical protein